NGSDGPAICVDSVGAGGSGRIACGRQCSGHGGYGQTLAESTTEKSLVLWVVGGVPVSVPGAFCDYAARQCLADPGTRRAVPVVHRGQAHLRSAATAGAWAGG